MSRNAERVVGGGKMVGVVTRNQAENATAGGRVKPHPRSGVRIRNRICKKRNIKPVRKTRLFAFNGVNGVKTAVRQVQFRV